jgi:hypothetical protein
VFTGSEKSDSEEAAREELWFYWEIFYLLLVGDNWTYSDSNCSSIETVLINCSPSCGDGEKSTSSYAGSLGEQEYIFVLIVSAPFFEF